MSSVRCSTGKTASLLKMIRWVLVSKAVSLLAVWWQSMTCYGNQDGILCEDSGRPQGLPALTQRGGESFWRLFCWCKRKTIVYNLMCRGLHLLMKHGISDRLGSHRIPQVKPLKWLFCFDFLTKITKGNQPQEPVCHLHITVATERVFNR